MRLFVGIALAAGISAQLQNLRTRLERPGDGLRWSAPESWHITLQFLGDTSPSQYDCLLKYLCQIQASPFSIQIEGASTFNRVGVFFAGIQLTHHLTDLQKQVIEATKPCGFTPEDRPYRPHITLARNQGKSDAIRGLNPSIGVPPRFPEFTAHELLLYESFLGPSGSRYEVRARFPLSMRHNSE